MGGVDFTGFIGGAALIYKHISIQVYIILVYYIFMYKPTNYKFSKCVILSFRTN